MKTIGLSALLSFLMLPAFVAAADFEAIPADLAQQLAKQLAEKAGKIEKLKFKVDADFEKANGIHIPNKVDADCSQKGLKEGEELAAKFKMDPGATLAYLFVYHLVPVVDGKKVEANRLHSVSFADNGGAEHELHVLLLSARQLGDDDYRLYVFGQDSSKPLIDVRLTEGTKRTTPVAVELKDPNETTHEGKIVVTVFGKYQGQLPGWIHGRVIGGWLGQSVLTMPQDCDRSLGHREYTLPQPPTVLRLAWWFC